MSDQEDKMQQQIADIGLRYLKRTLGELSQLRTHLDEARNGAPDAVKQIERMAHKIHGSGAMFGFDGVSGRAEELERLAGTGGSDSTFLQHLEAAIAALETQVQQDAQTRGVQ